MVKKFISPIWLAQTQCFGKHRFDDPNIAKQVAYRQAQRKDSKTGAYRCATCGGWHIGNSRNMKPNNFKNKS